jgi:hypothetical protein
MMMKKLMMGLMLAGASHLSLAQNSAAPAAPVTLTPEQKAQEIAGAIHACATAKTLDGWKNITISLDKTATGLQLYSVVVVGDNQVRPLELCDRQQVAQAMLQLLDASTKGTQIAWQSLLFRSQPNRQFEFKPLTQEDVQKLLAATPAKP